MDYEIMMNNNLKIGQQAPEINAISTMGNINSNDYKGKWIILFSHPGDFTPVCTTEIIAFAKANTYFENLNTCLIGLSVDSNSSHLAWLYDIYLKTGIEVPFPIIADLNGNVARSYGMIANDISSTQTVRNVFIIDDNGIIRAIFIYPMSVGRCIPEILRTLEALQTADKCEGSIPANWVVGNPIIENSPQTYSELKQRINEIEKNRNGMNWYLSFKDSCIKQEKSTNRKNNSEETNKKA